MDALHTFHDLVQPPVDFFRADLGSTEDNGLFWFFLFQQFDQQFRLVFFLNLQIVLVNAFSRQLAWRKVDKFDRR